MSSSTQVGKAKQWIAYALEDLEDGSVDFMNEIRDQVKQVGRFLRECFVYLTHYKLYCLNSNLKTGLASSQLLLLSHVKENG